MVADGVPTLMSRAILALPLILLQRVPVKNLAKPTLCGTQTDREILEMRFVGIVLAFLAFATPTLAEQQASVGDGESWQGVFVNAETQGWYFLDVVIAGDGHATGRVHSADFQVDLSGSLRGGKLQLSGESASLDVEYDWSLEGVLGESGALLAVQVSAPFSRRSANGTAMLVKRDSRALGQAELEELFSGDRTIRFHRGFTAVLSPDGQVIVDGQPVARWWIDEAGQVCNDLQDAQVDCAQLFGSDGAYRMYAQGRDEDVYIRVY